MQTLPLRRYQAEAIDAVYRELREHNRVAVVLPTGTGKTVVFSHLIARTLEQGSKRVLVLVHRDELAQQAAAKVRSVAPGVPVGIVKAEQNEVDATVVVASVQTLARQSRREQITGVGMVIVDECFPAGTLVGGRPIETIKIGDLVPSWDEETGQEVLRPVTAVMKKQAVSLVRVDLEDQTSIFCTANHPFLTTEGWVPAGLLRGELVVSFMHHADAPRDILRDLLDNRRAAREEEDRLLATIRSRLLQSGAPGRMGAERLLSSDGADEPEACLGSNATAEPDAPREDAAEDGRVAATGEASTSHAGWEWRTGPGTAATTGRLPGMADRSGDSSAGRRAPLSLQGGLRASVDEGLRRSGWGIPFRAGAPSLRPATGRTTVTRRVAHVQVLEPGSDGTYGGMCADGAVYNLEVEGTHTYLIEDGVVVHNCHHAVARTWAETLEHFGCFDTGALVTDDGEPYEPVPAVGFTATLYREDGKGLGNVWETVAYEKDIEWAIEHGYLTDVRGQQVMIEGFNLAEIAKSRGDYQEGRLGDALERIGAGEVIAQSYIEHASTLTESGERVFRRGVLFAPTVSSAQTFAQNFRDAGITAETIVGTTPREERQLIYKRYDAGEIDVLTNAMVLTEGWDSPATEVCVVARPTQNPGLYTQMVGRVLRPFPGKDEALVLDVVGIAGRHALQSLTTLTKVEVHEGESLVEAQERVAKETADKSQRERIVGDRKAREVELFKSSHSAWLQTKGGLWFIPVRVDGRSGEVVLWQSELGHWSVGLKRQGQPGEWIHKGLEFEYAMAWGDQLANLIDPTVADKNRSWRRAKPSDAQVDLAARMKLAPVDELAAMRRGALSDLLSIHFASRDLDKHLAVKK